MRFLKTLAALVLVLGLLFAVDFLGFYPLGKKTVALLRKTPLSGPIETWQLGTVRKREWEESKESLRQRTEELETQQKVIAGQEEALAAQEEELGQRKDKLEQLLAAQTEKSKQPQKQDSIKQQANLCARMKPQKAAQLLEQLELKVAKQILSSMESRSAARILEYMEPYKAAALLP